MDAIGLSSGLLAGWNPSLVRCKAFSSITGIVLRASIRGIIKVFTIINCYGPYAHRSVFWDNIQAGALLSLPNLLLPGDLNFTISSSKFYYLFF